MTKSRFFTSNNAKTDYVVTVEPALEKGQKDTLLVVKDYNSYGAEDLLQRYHQGAREGVLLTLNEVTKKLHLTFNPNGVDVVAGEKEFRTAVAKMGAIRGHGSRDSEDIIKKFEHYLTTQGVEAQLGTRMSKTPQFQRGGSAY